MSMDSVALIFGFLGHVKTDRDASSYKLEVHWNISKKQQTKTFSKFYLCDILEFVLTLKLQQPNPLTFTAPCSSLQESTSQA